MLKDDEPPSISVTKMQTVENAMVHRVVFNIQTHEEAQAIMSYLPKIKGYHPVYIDTPNMHILLNKSYWVNIETIKYAEENKLLPPILSNKIKYEIY